MKTSEMLDEVYNAQSELIKKMRENGAGAPDRLVAANGIVHELIARLVRNGDTELTDQPVVETEPPKGIPQSVEAFKVHGVQIMDSGKIEGTALYKFPAHAITIKKLLNAKYAELRVNMLAKTIEYPVLVIK